MESEQQLTPLMRQYKELKAQNTDAILLFRCGDFYETFYEDAVTVANDLQIALTSRNKNDPDPIPMAGVPYHAIDGYLAKLIAKGHKVAISEQMEDPKDAKGLVKRDIVKILSPGTITDPAILDSDSNNYLASFTADKEGFCFAFTDVSTGEFSFCLGDLAELSLAAEEFTVTRPKEVISFDNAATLALSGSPWASLNIEAVKMRRSDEECVNSLSSLFPKEHKSRFLTMPPLALKTLGILADYILDTQRQSLSHLSFPKRYSLDDGMLLDEATLANLELLPSALTQNIGGTLFETLNMTLTGMGGRMLKRWLLKPLTDKQAIEKRLELVDYFYKNTLATENLRSTVKTIPDAERVLSKVSLGSKNPRDLANICTAMQAVPLLKKNLEEMGLESLSEPLIDLSELTELLDSSLEDDLPTSVSDGHVIKDGISPEIDELRQLKEHGDSWLSNYEEQEREKTGIKNLRVKSNNVFGYFIEVSKLHSDSVPDHYTRKQTLVNSERYITAELKDYENKIFTAAEKLEAIEKEVFNHLIEKTLTYVEPIKQNAAAIAKIDVLTSLAKLAVANFYVKPEITLENVIDIEKGRHPVVEKFIDSGSFHPNDLLLNDERRQAIITGPNMSGKSTYLRQTALIVLMAQIGSFVPAAKAKIGIADRIFTRVGAFDNLLKGQSTFMVEMMETSNILKSATKRSLLIIDEIGRGTSTFDGLALAWSILEHINININ
ncbi:MAG: DNA mismatch repair protein MutS, partial [Candidatus Riflebacteria bacterium]|nr:DNA mismatch repair protein MutS [Candidatus Riflebacteria bacterium]